MRFYSEERLGPNRSLTPEGFLIARDVPIARTGSLLYAPGEVPIDPGKDGVISIGRDEADVFSPTAIASFEGKPVTNDHPPLGIKVDPTNWRQLAIGDVHNVRRGDGAFLDNQFLYADLIIKDAEAIRDILEGKKEVSAGYDAEYEQLEPGVGRQHDILGNHVALVDRGRCGIRCSIGDSNTMAKQRISSRDAIKAAFYNRDEATFVQELSKVDGMMGDIVSDDMPAGMPGGASGQNLHFHLGGKGMADEGAVPGGPPPAAVAPAPAAGTPAAGMSGADPLSQILQRIETLEQAVMLLAQDEGDDAAAQEAAPPAEKSDEGGGDDTMPGKVGDDASEMGSGDQDDWPEAKGGITATAKGLAGDRRRASVGDSTSLAPAFQDMISKAAILSPGYRLPTLDTARGARMTMDAMCNFRRTTLARAWATEDGRDVIGRLHQPARGKRVDFSRDAMTCDAATILFNGAAALASTSNTQDGQRRMAAVMDHGREVSSGTSRVPTIAEMNAKATEKWAEKIARTPIR